MDGMGKAFWLGLQRSARFVELFSAGLEGEDWYARPAGVPNTAIWTLGHLAYHRCLFLELLTGERVYPEAWRGWFEMGSTPLPDPHGYPDVATCRTYLDLALAKLEAYLESVAEADLAAPPLRPSRFLATKADVLAHAAAHEAHHTGSLALLRRLLGKERVI